MDSHATARHRIKVDLERHLSIAYPQAEQAAYGALIAPFADAQHGFANQ
jgi:hypothetical protein